MYARHLLVVWLGVILMTGWFGCERITSTIKSESQLSPADLPKRGVSVLPDFGKPVPEIRIAPAGDARGKSGGTLLTDQHELPFDRAELRAYIESIADIYKERYISLFVVADSVGNVYRYGYRPIFFHRNEEQLSRGEREMYVYIHPNSEQDGVWRMNIALIPKTPSALDGYRRWLLPAVYGSSCDDQQPAYAPKYKQGSQVQNWQTQACFWTTEFVPLGDTLSDGFEVIHSYVCIDVTVVNQLENNMGDGGPGGPCWTCDDPGVGGGGGSEPIPTGCDGDPDAYWDPICPGRCVGGGTGILPAPIGADCNNLNLPCAGDVVKNPEITSPGASGKNGGRFRPCVDGVSPGGASGGWWGPVCTNVNRAVRNSGLNQHYGLDISCNEGDPIYAPFDLDNSDLGSIPGSGYGNYLRGWATINGNRYNFGVAHLQSQSSIPADGKFKAGDIIGYCGRSGIASDDTRTHLHIEIGTSSVFSREWRVFLLDPEQFLSTRFTDDNSATPLNPNPCNQNP